MALRTVLITGANSGVGYATATLLSSFPTYHVIMTGRSLPKLQAAKQVIEATGTVQSQLSILHLDVTDLSTITAAAKQVEEQHGHLDVLINNAATGIRIPDMQTRLTEAYKTNVIGPALVSEAFRPLLLKSANPYSLYISSGVGSINLAMKKSAYKMQYEDAYRSSKAALNMLATLEYTDFKEQGLKVFVVSPGFVVSNLRGTSEEERSGWGQAGDPMGSAELIRGVVEGEREEDVGRFVWKEGVYEW